VANLLTIGVFSDAALVSVTALGRYHEAACSSLRQSTPTPATGDTR
jgi:hypothetical protein